jgi:multiple sugar transport system substrate-binding protein
MIYALCASLVVIPLLSFVIFTHFGNRGNHENNGCDGFVSSLDARFFEQLAHHPALPDIEVTKKIRFMSWYPVDEESPTAQLFRARYGVPAQQDEDDRDVIERIPVIYSQRYERLALAVAGDTSPDMFHYEDSFFPWGIHQKIFQPVDGIFDFSAPEWDATRPYIEAHRFAGRDYTAITEIVNSTSLLFYLNSTIAIHNLTDPYDLWQSGNWTWDIFEEMLEAFSDFENHKYGVMGFYLDDAIIGTTGTPIIGLENGLLSNNLDHGNIERATSFMQRLALNDLRYPYHTISSYLIDRQILRARTILFWNDGAWEYEETLQRQIVSDNRHRMKIDKNGNEYFPPEVAHEIFNDVGIVPWPRDPNTNTHYQRGKHDTMMLVSGARNVNGFKAWTMCAVLTAQSPEAQAETREKLKSDRNYTDHHLNVLAEIRKLPQTWDFKNGIGEDVSNRAWYSSIENLTKPVITMGESYNTHRENERGIIEARINEINHRARSPQTPIEFYTRDVLNLDFTKLLAPYAVKQGYFTNKDTIETVTVVMYWDNSAWQEHRYFLFLETADGELLHMDFAWQEMFGINSITIADITGNGLDDIFVTINASGTRDMKNIWLFSAADSNLKMLTTSYETDSEHFSHAPEHFDIVRHFKEFTQINDNQKYDFGYDFEVFIQDGVTIISCKGIIFDVGETDVEYIMYIRYDPNSGRLAVERINQQ